MTIEYRIYGNSSPNEPPDFSSPLATVAGLTYNTPPLESGETNTFAVLPIDTVTGLVCTDLTARVAITLDVDGNDTSGLPLAPIGLSVTAQSSGSAIVSFACFPRSGAKVVTVYAWVDGATPDYSKVWASIVPRNGPNRLNIGVLSDGVAYRVGVRATGMAGEEKNTATARVVGQSSGPSAVVGLAATAVP